MLPTKPPLDPFPYPRHPESRPLSPDTEPGTYMFVQSADGVVHVVPEIEGHLHPRVPGGGLPAAAAGGLKLGPGAVIVEVDNYSGTFQFGPDILPQVREALTRQGGRVSPDADRPFTY